MVEVAPPITPAPKPGRAWAKIILVVSLGLNLLFLGAIGGALLRDGPPRGAGIRDVNFGPLTDALSKQDREALRRSFQTSAPDLRGQRADIARDLEQLTKILRAPEFQRADAAALFVRQNDRALERQKLGQGLLLDLLAAMGPEQRNAFADRLEAVVARNKKRGSP
jgi:uncharacterized membrane protein